MSMLKALRHVVMDKRYFGQDLVNRDTVALRIGYSVADVWGLSRYKSLNTRLIKVTVAMSVLRVRVPNEVRF